jgi:hypothetical protein
MFHSSALRSIAAVVAGFVAASVVMMIIETINGRVLYPELGKAAERVTDRETIRALLATAEPDCAVARREARPPRNVLGHLDQGE